MRRKCKVFAALLLTLALTVCLALPSWAEPRIAQDTKGTITLNLDTSDTNVTATAYKVIDVKYYNKDSYEAPEDPEFYWVDDGEGTNGVADWVRTNHQSYIGTGTDNAVSSTFNDSNEKNGTVNVKEFASEMAAAIRRGTISGFSSHGPVSPTANSIVFNSLEMGTYLILVEGGTRIYSPVFVSLVPTWKTDASGQNGSWDLTSLSQEVTEKSEALTLQKKVFDNANLTDSSTHSLGKETENEDVQVQIGDTVTYILEADVPNYPADALNTSYEISDKLPDGMSLNAGNITVYGIVDSDTGTSTATPLTPKTDDQDSTGHYTQTVTGATRHGNNPVSFNLKFDYDKLHTDDAQTRFDKIRVVYTATANGSIQLVSTSNTSSTRVNLNTAYLDYSNNPYGSSESWESVNDDANVYSYGIKVDKVDQEHPENHLSGAIFTLKKDGPNEQPISFFKLNDGSYRVATQSEIQSTTTNLEVSKTTNTGKLQLSGLDVGTYILTEIQAPAGYHKPSAPISVPIQDNTTGINVGADQVPNGKPEYTDEEKNNHEAEDGYVPVTVTNTTGFTLPSTGGMGTVLFTTFGILLMGAGLVVLVLFLRRRSTK